MNADKYYTTLLGVIAGITIMSDHQYKWHIAIGTLVIAVLWVNHFLFGERSEETE